MRVVAAALITTFLACESSSSDKAPADASSSGDTSSSVGDDATTEGDTSDPSPEEDVSAPAPAVEEPADGPGALAVYSEGTCPTFEAGTQTFRSSGLDREVVVTLPTNPEGAGVVFLWHGFGDTHQNFSDVLGAKGMSKSENVITVAPQAVVEPMESEKLKPYAAVAGMMGPLPPTWSILDGPEPDLTLFDDLLTCLNTQFAVDRTRVYTFGFSQGAIFSGRLVMERADVLASAALWSGGLGSTGGIVEVVRIPYATPSRKIPVLAVAGGVPDLWPNEQLPLVNFQTGTDELSTGLLGDGHAVVACNHGLGHTIPGDGLTWGLEFMFAHVWTADGDSPYYGHDGKGFPKYCTMPPAR